MKNDETQCIEWFTILKGVVLWRVCEGYITFGVKSSLNERISEAVLKSSLMPFQSSDAMTFEIKTFEIENEGYMYIL